MATAQTLIYDAIYDIGVFGPTQTPDATTLAHALRVLNRMIGVWSAEGLMVPYTTSESFSTSSGTASYTMGSAGTASTTRALRMVDAYIRDSNGLDTPIEIIDQKRYNLISDKDASGRPDKLFYDPLYAIGYIYLWKVPNATYTCYIESIKSIHSTLASDTTVSLSPEYEEAIVSNLAVMLCPAYGKSVSNYLYERAKEAKRIIKNLNLANRMETMDMPAGAGGATKPYNINEG